MSILTKGLSKLFGSKSDRDIKAAMPYVDKTNQVYEMLKAISDDDLRNKTAELKDRINQALQQIDQEITDQHQLLEDEPNLSLQDKEAAFNKIDSLEEQRNKELEEVLMDILPEAFAVVKETARRFKDNGGLTVTATMLDKQLAANKSHIEIKGEKAIWKNEWEAAGTLTKWEMLHYDVQLIGGIVLHEGKIAEMATEKENPCSYLAGLPQCPCR